MSRTAVVLFNLGGPDSPAAVLPFLRNLFRDPAILRMPAPIRWLLAEVIARGRAPAARTIYGHIGGRSPIREHTTAQAQAVEAALAEVGGEMGDGIGEVRAFVAMRYWHPRATETAAAVRAFRPDRVVLVPLYPQFSTTTTASSLAEWRNVVGSNAETVLVGCYPTEDWFVRAYAECICPVLEQARTYGVPRVLFSAHGLPQHIADAGDPYPRHTKRTAAAVAAALGLVEGTWRLCYQSRVGRLAWIGPSTEDEVRCGGADGVPLVVAPISFVSEHSETLVELDIELRETARQAGVPGYFRAPAVSTNPGFIDGLANLVRAAVGGSLGRCPADARWSCPRAVCASVAAETRIF